MSSPPPTPPKALLFDIGGVCVVSPFQAILDYEDAHSIPRGWINHAISASAPNGSWQRLERGEIPLDDAFFAAFAADLANEELWPAYWRKDQEKKQQQQRRRRRRRRGENETAAGQNESRKREHRDEEQTDTVPPAPQINTPTLFWSMMRVSRTPDPWMYPALQRLRAASRAHKRFVLGGLSNTVVFPAGIRDERNAVFESGLRFEKRVADGDGDGSNETAVLIRGETDAEKASSSSSSSSPQTPTIHDFFPVFVSSAHVGLRKPDPAIYALALRELDAEARRQGLGGVRAEDVLFLDDIGQNLRAAREIGMRTLKVELGRSWKAVRELEGIVGLRLLDEASVPREDGRKAKL